MLKNLGKIERAIYSEFKAKNFTKWKKIYNIEKLIQNNIFEFALPKTEICTMYSVHCK